MLAPAGYPFVYLHNLCGKPAFYLKHMPNPGDHISSEDAISLDGKKPAYGSEITCGSCGASIPKLSSADVCLAAS